MEKMNCFFSVNKYDKSVKISQDFYAFSKDVNSNGIALTEYSVTPKDGYTEKNIVFTAKENLQEAGVSLIYEIADWEKENYVFAPSALYKGNRFKSVKREYAPMYTKDEAKDSVNGPIITDVPRLSLEGQGRAQLNTGDLATPCIGYFSEAEKKGFMLFWRQQNELGNFGITVDENINENKARFILSAPCVREETKYGMCTMDTKSDDRGADLKKGDKITFKVEEHCFECENETEFLQKFFELRCRPFLPRTLPNKVPFSHAFSLLEEKYNKRNWVEKEEFYKSSEGKGNPCCEWQTGWVGGCMNTLPGLMLGNSETVEKSEKTLDFVFGPLQHKSGFLYGMFYQGKPYGDSFESQENINIVMSRKNGDALYYLVKHFMYLKKAGKEIKPQWENGLRKLADAFIAFYDKNGDLAQFIDLEKLEPFVHKTASAAVVPAGLALCGVYYNDKKYIEYAEKITEEYYNNYVKNGFTNGGPGEIMGCPDSESAFGMLESTVALYSVTNDEKYLKYARDTANLCSSWCVSYDYKYESDTQWAIRKIATSGAVWASVQNKHAAPGICTLSGASLFRLYRATGDIRYLELCRDIAHNITQYISTREDPMYMSYIWGGNPKPQKRFNNRKAKFLLKTQKAGGLLAKLFEPASKLTFNAVGRMGERCNLSDWEGTANVGELPGGSCWCEVSTMMTYLEIPAAYIQPDTGFVFAIDHLNCAYENGKIIIENPTDYDATYRIFIENSAETSEPLQEMFMMNFKTVNVPAHKKITINI